MPSSVEEKSDPMRVEARLGLSVAFGRAEDGDVVDRRAMGSVFTSVELWSRRGSGAFAQLGSTDAFVWDRTIAGAAYLLRLPRLRLRVGFRSGRSFLPDVRGEPLDSSGFRMHATLGYLLTTTGYVSLEAMIAPRLAMGFHVEAGPYVPLGMLTLRVVRPR
jgi:hypothetical protein